MDITANFQKLSGGSTSSSLISTSKTQISTEVHELCDISSSIQHIENGVKRLSSLVNRHGLFDNNSEEMKALIVSIKRDLDKTMKRCDDSQTNIQTKMGIENQQINLYHSIIIGQLQIKMADITKSFRSLLELHSTKIKEQSQLKIQLGGNGMLNLSANMNASSLGYNNSNSNTNNSSNSGNENKNINVNDNINNKNANVNTNKIMSGSSYYDQAPGLIDKEDGGAYNYSTSLQNNIASQQQQLLLAPTPQNSTYFESRQTEAVEVEKSILELGTLFNRLSTMVSEQQVLIERVDDDVEAAMGSVDGAKNELTRAYDNATDSRSLMWKLGAVLTTFTLFFTFVLL